MLFHGVNIEERPTRLLPPREVSAAIPFVVGVAPVHRSASVRSDVINKPVLITSYQEYIERFGGGDESKYTLSEFARVFFGLYRVGPVMFVNVMDPASTAHGTGVAAADATLVGGVYTLAADIDLSSLVVKSDDGNTTYTPGVHYTATYNSTYGVVITRLDGEGGIPTATSALKLDYTSIGEAPCDGEDVIGGIVDNANTGLECIEDVYPLHSLIPGLIVCPGFSHLPAVAAAMDAKCTGINSLFAAFALVDVDSTAADTYSEVNAWKVQNGYTSAQMGVCWPKVKLGDNEYWASSHVAGRIAATDADNGGLPYASPSNKALQINGLVADGSDVILSIPKADALNQQGVVTGLNFEGWKCWGNRTGAYPASTDPKDAFISIRRMMNWIGNNAVLLLWQKLDDPITRRTVETAVDSLNQWFNGLISRGALNAGRCDFVSGENSASDLAAGKVTLHLYVTPPAPAEQINVILEYDVTGNTAVFLTP